MAGLAWLAGLGAGLTWGAQPALVWPASMAGAGALAAKGGSSLRLIAIVVAAVLFGAWRASLTLPGLAEGPLTPFRDQMITLRGTLAESPNCGASSCLFVIQVQELETPTGPQGLEGRVQVRTRPSTDLSYGRLVQVRGELRAPRAVAGYPRVDLLARRGIHEIMDYPLVRLGPAVDLAPPRRFEALRSGLEQRLSSNIPGAEGQLAAGLLLGSDVAIPQELRAQLRASGTSHILAVSGFNVAVVGGVVLGLGGRVLGRYWALALAGLAVSIYTMLVGAPPSAVRAALMLGAVGLASAVGRLPDPPTSLILAAALMGAIEPLLLLDIGFQLSFAATAGLVLLGSSLTPTWRRLPRWVGTVLGMTLAAQLFTLPLVLHTFHSVSLVAPLANVLVAPLLPALMGSAALDLMLGWVPALGPLLHGLVWLLSHVVLTVIGSAAGLPGAMLATGRFPVWALLAAYGCILGALAMRNLSTPFGWFPSIVLARAAPAVGLAALAVVAHLATARSAQPEQLRALFFDAAGDGLTLLESPSGHRVLVGSAGSPLAVAALAEQLPLLDRAIDLLVVTRTGARDLDGLGEIVRRYPIGLVLQPGAGRGDSWSRWNALLAERSIPTSTAWPGAAVELGDVLLELDGVVEESAERLPSLSMRLLYGALDLRLVGGVAPTAMEGGKTVVVRLAPEIALNRELAERLVVMDHRVAVVGGRASLSQVDGPIRMPLANADLVELASDGTNTRIWRTPCGVGHERCVWP